jgi:hypothetical protein
MAFDSLFYNNLAAYLGPGLALLHVYCMAYINAQQGSLQKGKVQYT